jgi:hypothetical protein
MDRFSKRMFWYAKLHESEPDCAFILKSLEEAKARQKAERSEGLYDEVQMPRYDGVRHQATIFSARSLVGLARWLGMASSMVGLASSMGRLVRRRLLLVGRQLLLARTAEHQEME